MPGGRSINHSERKGLIFIRETFTIARRFHNFPFPGSCFFVDLSVPQLLVVETYIAEISPDHKQV